MKMTFKWVKENFLGKIEVKEAIDRLNGLEEPGCVVTSDLLKRLGLKNEDT